MAFANAYAGKRVLVTGHTGFKGSWLCQWLSELGAEVTGFALPPNTEPALYHQLGLSARLRHVEGDIRDLAAVTSLVKDFKPNVVFHLAAQPLVRLSYSLPVETYAVNVMGTVNVLEAVRVTGIECAVVAITTDKCYENKEWMHSYREEDALGGYDPYSSSKGAAELAIGAYRRSFFSQSGGAVSVASARAGNVVGGGDWAADRIVPDCIRALQRSTAIPVRNKIATRPWQHVLEPLSGYLWLGACLSKSGLVPLQAALTSAFNFGPSLASNRTVKELVVEILKSWPGNWEDRSDPQAVHEATRLNLAADKAFHLLQWQPVWDFETTVRRTVEWYRESQSAPGGIPDLTSAQIRDYTTDARTENLRWTL